MRNLDINVLATWPPGSMMQFKSNVHTGIGIVVANRRGSIAVLWDGKCNDPFTVYPVSELDALVISRII